MVKLLEMEQNVYWCMGSRLKCHAGCTDLKDVRIVSKALLLGYSLTVARRNAATLAKG